MELPQDRRQNVLDLLPQPQNTKILALLGYHDATAGGLMGTDFLALPEEQTVADALLKLQTVFEPLHKPLGVAGFELLILVKCSIVRGNDA